MGLEEETVLETKEAGSEESVSSPRGNNGKTKEVLELIAPVSEKLIVPSIQKDKQDEKVLETTGAATEEPLTCPRGNEAKETWVLEVTGPPVTGQEISSPNENNTSEQKGLEPMAPTTEQQLAASSENNEKEKKVLETTGLATE